ncbi:MAG: HAD hydrolase family protein [Candidatus Cloacimonetes bacterium]|nr:HAD hydrolase family protein [Candidatus Cloacimonadota bacterium]
MKDFNKIKLLILDCDGVLTDGKVIYDSNQNELKNFSAKDGIGIKLLSFSEIKIAIITGRESEMLSKRCEDLGITMLFQKIRNKIKKTKELINGLHLNWENVAYLGDDWNDYPVMEKCQISAVPNDAFDDIKNKVDIITKRKGGEGAVREFIEIILKKQGIYEEIVEKFISNLKNL